MNLEFMIIGGLVEAIAIWNLYVFFKTRKVRAHMKFLEE